MSPEEKEFLRVTVKLSEENHKILKKLERHVRWQSYWGLIKLLMIVVPLILGYVFLQPYLGSALNNYREIQGMIENPENPTRATSTPLKFDRSSLQKLIQNL